MRALRRNPKAERVLVRASLTFWKRFLKKLNMRRTFRVDRKLSVSDKGFE